MTAPPKPRRGRGRPSLSGGGATTRITTALPGSTLAALEARAEKTGRRVPEVARAVLSAWARRQRGAGADVE